MMRPEKEHGLSAPPAGPQREALERIQLEKLRTILEEILPSNRFYARKLASHGLGSPVFADLHRVEDLSRLPFTTKGEIQADQEANPPFGTNLTYPLERYLRMHQTSGTTGRPIRWLDTRESWSAILRSWETIYRAAGLGPGERVFVPFSFGPFLGFWAAFEGAERMGMMALPGGGMTSAGRLRFLLENRATVVCATPTYALRLADVAREEGIDLRAGAVKALIVAGEPGGSTPAVRERIESSWGARCFDHWGMTEVGSLGFEAAEDPGTILILETDCIPEVIDPATGAPVGRGGRGELVITTLERAGSPLVRYRTGDLVSCGSGPSPGGRPYLRLEGGILGRLDDMFLVHGNNVYPSAVDAVLRRLPQLLEYQALVKRRAGAASELRLRVEPAPGADGPALVEEVRRAFREALFFRPEVELAPAGSLPRFEMKARRFIEEEKTP